MLALYCSFVQSYTPLITCLAGEVRETVPTNLRMNFTTALMLKSPRRIPLQTVVSALNENRSKSQLCTLTKLHLLYVPFQGDYVFYLDFDTDCGDISDDIEDELGCRSGYRRYKYGTGYRRYRYYKNRWWNRYHKDDDRKSKKSKKDDESDTPRHRWWQHPRRPWW